MQYELKKVQALSVTVEDKIGFLAEAAQALRDAGINLKAIAGWQSGGGQATILTVPEDIAALRALLARYGKAAEQSELLMVTGADELGALCTLLSRLARGGVNLKTIHALAVDGKFAALLDVGNVSVDAALRAAEG
jgi:hypothetical protein